MIIRHPKPSDWENFYALARGENWRVPHSELMLFQGEWAQYAYVLDDNSFCGLVTAVAYEKSAWIGNLIVPQSLRGKGYGSHLFRAVFTGLIEQGMASVWLTASEQGRRIYQQEGFSVVDRVERWVLPPQQGTFAQAELPVDNAYEDLLQLDSSVWGESRASLLSVLCRAGKILSVGNSIALVQQNPEQQIIGPWYSCTASDYADHDLLQKVVATKEASKELVLDCLSSSKTPSLCNAFGFDCSGQTSLMAFGDVHGVDLNPMMSFASMGSMG